MENVIRFPTKKKEVKDELIERTERIRNSLDRINQLIEELKQMSKKESQGVNTSKR